ncbi:MAG: protein jag [Lachnospiraceae bacterium]|nr:protein jag [Lachnospiraceae bacterium]
MKKYMEFSAKTVDEAITKALLELGISSDRLEYEVVEKGSSGILGMFVKPAVIRVAKPEQDEDEFLLNPTAKSEKKEEPKEASVKEKKTVVKEITKESPRETPKEPLSGSKSPRPEKKPRAKESVREFSKEKPGDMLKEEKPVVKNVRRKEDLEPAMAELLTRAENFLQEMFRAMQMEVKIEAGFDEDEKTIVVDLNGEEMGVLIGKRGQTLDSIQYLTSLVVNKGEEEYIRVKVDTENYRERRRETLEVLAKNISYKVKRTRRPVSLEPMNPYERRVIHAALQNDKYVVTRSEGVEPYRHIVISPRNTRYGSRK